MMQKVIRVLYPPHCLGCNSIVAQEGALCGPCWRETRFAGGLVCDGCAIPLHGDRDGGAVHCDACLAAPRPWDRARAAMLYSGTAKRMVMALKHNQRADLAPPAGRWIADAARDITMASTLVAPVPVHWLRRIARRYDQADLLAHAVAKHLGLPVCSDLLTRRRYTPMMQNMGAQARFANVEGAFIATPRRRLHMAGRHVLLVDDVMTSGATLAAATAACLAGGAGRVSVAVLARVAKQG